MGIPWRSAESMHWQLGEQEMSARANAPVFQLHPSATGTGLHSPPNMPGVPVPASGQQVAPPHPQQQAPTSHGFTPANPPQYQAGLPPPPPPPQQQQQPSPPSQGPSPTHSYHHRSDSGSSLGRGRASSFTRRRARNSVPPQLGPTLPQIHPRSEADLVSGAKTAPALESGMKREDCGPFEELGKRKREDEGLAGLRAEADARSQGGRSPDRVSLRSGTGSVKSIKRSVGDADDAE